MPADPPVYQTIDAALVDINARSATPVTIYLGRQARLYFMDEMAGCIEPDMLRLMSRPFGAPIIVNYGGLPVIQAPEELSDMYIGVHSRGNEH